MGVYKTYDEIRNELSGKNDNFGKLFLEFFKGAKVSWEH